jgi:hypothetical protein
MRFVLLLILLPVVCMSQPSVRPFWLQTPPPPPAASQPPGGGGNGGGDSVQKPVVKRITVRDTVRIVSLDTVYLSKTDTVRDTVVSFPVQYKYTVRYALTSLNVEIRNPEWLDYASVSEIIARDTATLRIGSEEVRTLGNMVDQFGNRFPQQDIITTGFTINIFGDRANMEYRGKSSVAVFSGNFDNSGFLIATGEIAESSFLGSVFPFSLFFGVSKRRIIIEILREAYL